jgi:glycine betaine/proline transport system ATP-binding protein
MSPTISCTSVYKIFGDNAQKLLSENKGKVDAAKFQEAGCIVGS